MIILFRVVICLIQTLFRPKLRLTDESRISILVLPNDVDVNVHMNNGRYLTFMDLGRFDLTARCGLLREAVKRRYFPMVGSAMIRFVRPVDHLERFELVSRFIGWDEKWFYAEQRFEVRGETRAIALIKGLFTSRAGSLPPAEVAALAGWTEPSPQLPPAIRQWVESEREAFTPKERR